MVSRRHLITINNLPHEVLSDIFIRLLAKQLAQMRCTCKSWNALLSESSFVKYHLHHSMHHNDEILLFFKRLLFLGVRGSFTAHPSRSPDLELTNFIKFPVCGLSERLFGYVIGSVNGLICLEFESSHNKYDVQIWNLSLYVVLTLPPFSLPSHDSIYLRFGFDPRTDDYKIVKLTSHFERGQHIMSPQVEIYSMRKGLWELIPQGFTSHIKLIGHGEVCADGYNGHVHWLGYVNNSWKPETIVAFDLGAKTFREMPLPDSMLDYHERRRNVLGVLAGKLCVMSCPIDGGCEVWVMDKYEVAESWVKHHAFSQFSGVITAYGFTSHSEFVFEVDDRFTLYDPIAAKTKTFKITHDVCKIVEYVDSLVWVAPAKRNMVDGQKGYKRQHMRSTSSIILL